MEVPERGRPDTIVIERSVFAENSSYSIGGVAIGSQLPGDRDTVSAIRDCMFIANVSDSVVAKGFNDL